MQTCTKDMYISWKDMCFRRLARCLSVIVPHDDRGELCPSRRTIESFRNKSVQFEIL